MDSFSEVTILKLDPILKYCSMISNSKWKISQKFSRFNCCFIFHWGIKKQRKRRRRLVVICLRTSDTLFNFLTVKQIPGIDLFTPCLSFLECYLPIIVKMQKQELVPKSYHCGSQVWRYLVQESIGFAPASIKDYKRSYKYKCSQITSRHLHHFKSIISLIFCLFVCC